MKTRLLLGGALAALVVIAGAGLGFGEEEPAAPQPMSEQELWAKMAELAQPSAMHKEVLARLIGTWEATGKIFSEMGEIPITGRAEHTSVLGGRFIQIAYAGPFMGGTFEGAGFVGYDNLGQQFQQVWVMTMATNIDVMTGTWDEESKTLTWRGSAKMPDGRVFQKRTTARFESDDKFSEEAFSTGPDGVERKEMELTYTRTE